MKKSIVNNLDDSRFVDYLSFGNQHYRFSIVTSSTPNIFLFEIEIEVFFSSYTEKASSVSLKSRIRVSNDFIKNSNKSTSRDEIIGVCCEAIMEILRDCDRVWA